MAIQTPRHRQGLHLLNDFHLSDIAVTTGAAHACPQVSAMVEIGEIGELVDANPLHRLAGGVAFADFKKLFAFGENQLVAVHTNGCRREDSYRRCFDIIMAIAAIDTEVAGVKFMAVGHRLGGTIANIGVFWGKIIPDETDNANSDNDDANRDIRWEFVSPSGENLRQS